MTTTRPALIDEDVLRKKEEPFLPFSAPWFGAEEKEEILKVLDSDWITTGPRTKSFEEAFRKYTGSKEAVAVNSCTAALHLALSAMGIGPGDAVVTVPFTFAATANVIVHCGAQPIFVDIQPDTYNLDPLELEKFFKTRCEWSSQQHCLVTNDSKRRIRCVIAVHYAGHPCDMKAICALTKEYGIAVIEDAAHALGAAYQGQKVGALADAACFSFYPTKNISTGEGGMLTTDNSEIANRARILTLHGISRDAWKRYGKEGSWRYDVEEAGFKFNLTDLASALGLHQLRKLPQFIRRREELAARYDQLLAVLPLKRPTVRSDVLSAWHLYPVELRTDIISRDALIEVLRRRNIGASVHFIPLHLMSFYQREYGYKQGDFPVAERVFERILSLPFFPRMTDEDVLRVARTLTESLR